jgi:hypothetical protein
MCDIRAWHCGVIVGGASSRRLILEGGVNRAAIFETRREYVHVGSEQTSMFATVSKTTPRFPFSKFAFAFNPRNLLNLRNWRLAATNIHPK